MTVTLVFLALLMAGFVAWLVAQSLNVRPWVAQAGRDESREGALPEAATAPRLGLVVLLAAITSIFALSISAYMMRMEHAGDWRAVPEPMLLWGNTGVLLLSSIALQWAWNAARHGNLDRFKTAFLAGGALTLGFVGGQYLVWRQLAAAGYYLADNPANAFFYLLTALHALHLLGGMVAWGRALRKLRAGAGPGELRASAELCAIYWHYLFVIWIVLFSLVLTT